MGEGSRTEGTVNDGDEEVATEELTVDVVLASAMLVVGLVKVLDVADVTPLTVGEEVVLVAVLLAERDVYGDDTAEELVCGALVAAPVLKE